jgi:hypothetical protein
VYRKLQALDIINASWKGRGLAEQGAPEEDLVAFLKQKDEPVWPRDRVWCALRRDWTDWPRRLVRRLNRMPSQLHSEWHLRTLWSSFRPASHMSLQALLLCHLAEYGQWRWVPRPQIDRDVWGRSSVSMCLKPSRLGTPFKLSETDCKLQT